MANTPKQVRKSVKTSSAKTPSGKKVAVQKVKGVGTVYGRDSKPPFDKKGNQAEESLSLKKKNGKNASMSATKRAIRGGKAGGIY